MESKVNIITYIDSIFTDFTLDDVDSIQWNKLRITPRAQKFIDYCRPHMTYARHCFWSGKNAKIKCRENKAYLSDKDVPFIKELFELCNILRDQGKPYLKMFAFAVSRVFALYSKGPTAVIYLSSDKSTEPAGLTTGTNLYEAELPVLVSLLHGKVLEHIHLYVEGVPYGPIHHIQQLPIYRRYVHPLDPISTHISFVSDSYQQSDYDQWRLEPPRKYITAGRIRKILLRWQKLIAI